MGEIIHPFELTESETFLYGGELYTVVEKPTGEFNTYVKVRRGSDRQEMEIIIPSGTMVTTVDQELDG